MAHGVFNPKAKRPNHKTRKQAFDDDTPFRFRTTQKADNRRREKFAAKMVWA